MAPGSPLERLSVEIQVHIASFLDQEDLIAARQSCPALEVATHDAFTKAFFSRKRFRYTPVGLQALVDVASLPTLRRALRMITFVVQGFSFSDREDENYITEQRPEQSRALRHDGLDARLLTAAFGLLAGAGLTPNIYITADFRHARVLCVCGSLAFFALRGLDPRLYDYVPVGEYDSACRSVFAAMASAKFPPQTLALLSERDSASSGKNGNKAPVGNVLVIRKERQKSMRFCVRSPYKLEK